MKGILLTCLIGVIAGAIDVLPMIKMKLDRFSIVSAFVFYFILPFIILNTELFGMPWWLKGGVIGFALALPVIIIVAGQGEKKVSPLEGMVAGLLVSIWSGGDVFILL